MGFFDNLKDALGAERDQDAVAAESSSASSGEPRHVDRDAPDESPYGPQITGGKHASRD